MGKPLEILAISLKQMQKLNRPIENYDFDANYIVDRNQKANSTVNEMTINFFSDMKFEILMQLLFAAAFILMGLYFSKIQQEV